MSGWLLSAIPVGATLAGRYQVLGHVADGAFASVYKARDNRSGGTVALKVLDPLRGADPVGRVRFEREFDVLCKVSHKGVARCFALERDGDLDVLVLEYVEGMTLQRRVEIGRIERLEEAVDIAVKVADALAACHAVGVLHRDLKPENIVLHPQAGAMVLDFGVAWFSAAASLTRTGALIGSPQYLAPELFGSTYADARAEVYAVGAILFEMVTGRAVRLGGTVAELARRSAEVPALTSTLRADVPAWLDAIVARAVAPRPEDRFATMAELAQALRSGSAGAARGLKARTVCRTCRTEQVVDVPICVGCGKPVAWGLRPGAFAVQLISVRDVERTAAWLERRHGAHIAPTPAALRARLRHVPIAVALGVSEETAEQLRAEAQDVGCKAEVVRAHALFGASLKSAAASVGESMAALAGHTLAVLVTGAVLAAVLPATLVSATYGLPAMVGLLGVLAANAYLRRALLRVPRSAREDAEALAQGFAAIATRLAKIETERARGLAAGAVLRASPVLAGAAAGAFSHDARERALASLHAALDACAALDAHALFLQGRTRARLTAAIEGARVRVERGDDNAECALRVLEHERDEILEASVAHDLAAREALACSANISDAVARG